MYVRNLLFVHSWDDSGWFDTETIKLFDFITVIIIITHIIYCNLHLDSHSLMTIIKYNNNEKMIQFRHPNRELVIDIVRLSKLTFNFGPIVCLKLWERDANVIRMDVEICKLLCQERKELNTGSLFGTRKLCFFFVDNQIKSNLR